MGKPAFPKLQLDPKENEAFEAAGRVGLTVSTPLVLRLRLHWDLCLAKAVSVTRLRIAK